MSYNLDDITLVKSDSFCVELAKLRKLQKKLDQRGEYYPELNIFDQAEETCAEDAESWTPGEAFWWTGEGSGSSVDVLEKQVLPLFTGSAELVCCWEGGDSYSGYRVVNGIVTKHEVALSLVG